MLLYLKYKKTRVSIIKIYTFLDKKKEFDGVIHMQNAGSLGQSLQKLGILT